MYPRSFRGSPKSIMDLQGILGWLSYYTMEILNYGDLLTYLLTEPITEMLSHLKMSFSIHFGATDGLSFTIKSLTKGKVMKNLAKEKTDWKLML